MPRTSKSCAKCTRAGHPGSDLRGLSILSLTAHGEEKEEEGEGAAAVAEYEGGGNVVYEGWK